jgi:hypothetical protein
VHFAAFRKDPYRQCTKMGVKAKYMTRVAAAPERRTVGALAILTTALTMLHLARGNDP